MHTAQQAGIAVAEKAIPLIYSIMIGRQNLFMTRKGANEHEQGLAWQMKISKQHIYDAKMIARRYKNICLTGKGG